MTSTKEYHAAFMSALSHISGQRGEPTRADYAHSIVALTTLADAYPPAKAKLAVLTALGDENANDREKANSLFLEAAMSGYPPSVRDLGLFLITSGEDEGMGAGLLCRAASHGDWVAGFLILREACRGRHFLSAQSLKGLAGQLSGLVPFRAEIQTKIGSIADDIPILDKNEFIGITFKQALERLPMSVSRQFILNAQKPSIRSFDCVLSPLECDYLIAVSVASMQSSKVVSAETGDSISAGYRTSDGTVLLPHMLDYPGVRIIEKLSSVCGVKPHNGEFLSLLKYAPGQEYLPHHDYLDADKNDYSMISKCGQRCATLLTYLNDGYEGGETEFPNLDITYKGKAGNSLYFKNTDKAGMPISDSLHAGLPVRSGEKWLATLWIREKPFWSWMRES